MMSLDQANAQQDLSRSLLRLTYLLQSSKYLHRISTILLKFCYSALQDGNTHSAIELLMNHPSLLENLRKAHMGNYGIILSLLGCLDDGQQAKKLVDRVIDDGETNRMFISCFLNSLCSGSCHASARRHSSSPYQLRTHEHGRRKRRDVPQEGRQSA